MVTNRFNLVPQKGKALGTRLKQIGQVATEQGPVVRKLIIALISKFIQLQISQNKALKKLTEIIIDTL